VRLFLIWSKWRRCRQTILIGSRRITLIGPKGRQRKIFLRPQVTRYDITFKIKVKPKGFSLTPHVLYSVKFKRKIVKDKVKFLIAITDFFLAAEVIKQSNTRKFLHLFNSVVNSG